MEVEDLFTDLADGIKLLKLLEIISSEKLGKPNSGRMRVHKIENVNKSLAFLHTKVRAKEMAKRKRVRGRDRGLRICRKCKSLEAAARGLLRALFAT